MKVVPEKIVEREGDLEAVNVIGQGLGKENDVLALAHHVIKKGVVLVTQKVPVVGDTESHTSTGM